MISYELALTLAAFSVLLAAGAPLRLTDVVWGHNAVLLQYYFTSSEWVSCGVEHLLARRCGSASASLYWFVVTVSGVAENEPPAVRLTSPTPRGRSSWPDTHTSTRLLTFASSHVGVACDGGHPPRSCCVTLFSSRLGHPLLERAAVWWASLLTIFFFTAKVHRALLRLRLGALGRSPASVRHPDALGWTCFSRWPSSIIVDRCVFLSRSMDMKVVLGCLVLCVGFFGDTITQQPNPNNLTTISSQP